MAGGSLHPHGKLHKVNLERRGDNRRGYMAAECLWANALHHRHSRWQALTTHIETFPNPRSAEDVCVRVECVAEIYNARRSYSEKRHRKKFSDVFDSNAGSGASGAAGQPCSVSVFRADPRGNHTARSKN